MIYMVKLELDFESIVDEFKNEIIKRMKKSSLNAVIKMDLINVINGMTHTNFTSIGKQISTIFKTLDEAVSDEVFNLLSDFKKLVLIMPFMEKEMPIRIDTALYYKGKMQEVENIYELYIDCGGLGELMLYDTLTHELKHDEIINRTITEECVKKVRAILETNHI